MAAQDVRILGHRGARTLFPENTLAAFRSCLDNPGIDGFEFDVWWNPLVKEGLVIHERDVGETTTGEGLIDQLYTHQISDLRCRLDGAVTEEVVPYLEEVLALVADSGRSDFIVNVELKAEPEDGDMNAPIDFEHYIATMSDRYRGLNFLFSCFDSRRVVQLKRLRPHLQIGALMEGVLTPSSMTRTIQDDGLDWLCLRRSSVSREVCKTVHDAKAKVAVWTANEPEEWDRLILAGCDAIITDHPHALAIHLGR
jgi:glycerophosphoryl diester phosphodiesterase